jgi:hypothetical protein
MRWCEGKRKEEFLGRKAFARFDRVRAALSR